jgi:hypothetical protein
VPKVGARIRFRTSSGETVEGTVVDSKGTLDSGHVFSHARGDRLLRYHKPSRAPAAKADAALTAAPTSYGFYLNIALHVLSLGTALVLAAKLWGFL